MKSVEHVWRNSAKNEWQSERWKGNKYVHGHMKDVEESTVPTVMPRDDLEQLSILTSVYGHLFGTLVVGLISYRLYFNTIFTLFYDK